MRLYSVGRSPYAARVRAVIDFKGLAVEIAPPPEGGIKGDLYLALNPMGRLPTLELDDGSTLPESEVIVEYLEQVFPTPSLTPADPLARARARLVARVAELYVMAPLFALFGQLAPDRRDEAEVSRLFGQIAEGLGHLEGYLEGDAYAVSPTPTLADCALAPFLFWVGEIARMFARPDPIAGLPKLDAYRARMAADPLFGPLVRDMSDDLAALRSGASR